MADEGLLATVPPHEFGELGESSEDVIHIEHDEHGGLIQFSKVHWDFY